MKIIQILIGPDGYNWQGNMFGLGDDGKVYVALEGKWKLNMDSTTTENYTERLLEVVEMLVDDEPCRLDHHGNCQAHNLENPCTTARARALIKEIRGTE